MHTKRTLALALMAVLAIGACNAATTPSASAPASQAAAPAPRPAQRPRLRRPAESAAAEPARGRSGRGGHPERRAERRDRLLDVLPVADLRPVHQGHDRPLRGHVPGRQGQLGRPSGDLPGRPQGGVRRGQRPRRHQPLGQRGLGLGLREQGPAPVARRRSPRKSRTSTTPACGNSSWSTARTSSSRGTRASQPS